VIVAEILAGMGRRARAQVQRNRAAAVAHTINTAAPGDVVLVAGKGHETSQVIGDRELPYSDRDTVTTLLQEAQT
ncbi:MAG: UDP-N-acetylmuramoyl-L-alanyl-D-glutamate--2,6-diaminopimelate ligase, partial [Gammaproteobacteria bacterium]|nr:UDP-N-acetylmuramoyl-L-alanyl-D-glutamate--2,6-diaminopimelate ligase [Gammaproteobacteria bacterium]